MAPLLWWVRGGGGWGGRPPARPRVCAGGGWVGGGPLVLWRCLSSAGGEGRGRHGGPGPEKSEQSVGNILLSSQRTTCNGPVGGAASSDSIRFCSNFVSFRLICPFVFSWYILTLSSSTSTCLPSGFKWSSMSVPKVRPGSGVSFLFRPFFRVPASDPEVPGS